MSRRSTEPARKRSRWLRRLVWSFGTLVVLAAGGLAAMWWAATSTPDWYQPASIDYTLLEQDKKTIVALTERVSATLHDGKPVELTLDEAQINRWLAGRLELWPDAGSWLPNEVSRPLVQIEEDGRVRVGITLAAGALRTVVAMTLRAEVTPELVFIDPTALHFGVLPTPISWLKSMIPDDLYDEIRFTDRGMQVRNEFSLPNSRRRFGVTSIRTEGDALIITLTPR